jgi:pyruvate dehydrogenase E2 component (dihydrolipoamide acetyltransferase)
MRDLGLTPETVRGSGPHGRIVEADVRRHADERSVAALPPFDQAVSTPISPSTRDSAKARRAIARVTSASAATVPQFELRAEIDASQLVAVREQIVDSIARDAGVRLSYTDLMLRALALALADQPSANTVWRDDSPVHCNALA